MAREFETSQARIAFDAGGVREEMADGDIGPRRGRVFQVARNGVIHR